MRLISYSSDRGPRIAAVRDAEYIDLGDADPSLPTSMKALLAGGAGALDRARAALGSGQPLPASTTRLLAPVPDPGKVICVGLNYADHAKESGVDPPAEPVIFNKFPSAVAAHGDSIRLPKVSEAVDYEAELVAVIGTGGKHIAREQAYRHIAGYCVGHDVSARDWQLHKPGKQWLLGKTFDTFAPFGPYLVTADEVPDPNNLGIRLRLNGQTMQDSNTSQFIFKLDELIAYISSVCTLEPGDVLFTGTPPGVGFARKPPVLLGDGDEVEVEIDGLGVLVNRCTRE